MNQMIQTSKGVNVRRAIKQRERRTYNHLRSIYEDSLFVHEMLQTLAGGGASDSDPGDPPAPRLPLLANLRCGAWYSDMFDGDCYFKSTDGHTNHWAFSMGSRLNANVLASAAKHGGVIIVDSTKSIVKKFPDALSKTIPIWCAVFNRAIQIER